MWIYLERKFIDMQNLRLSTLIWFLIISLIFSKTAGAQKAEENKEVLCWLSVGAGPGFGTRNSDMAIGSLIEIAVAKEKSALFAGLREFGEGSTGVLATANIRDKMQCFELRYGRLIRKKNTILSINTGLSYVSGTFKGDLLDTEGGWFSRVLIYEKITGKGIGFPLSAQFKGIISKRFALGIEAYANINKVCTFYGVNLNVNFGKLRQNKKQS